MVIKNLPVKFPVTFTLILWLYLDKYNAPEWILAVIATLMIILWAIIYSMQRDEEKIDLFSGYKPEDPKRNKKSFQERLEEKAKKRATETYGK